MPDRQGALISAIFEFDQSLRVAFAFLTRMPIRIRRTWQAGDLAASAPFFPVVGALIGALGATVLIAADIFWPGTVAAVLAMLAMIAATGGLHEDGLADFADGFGGREPEHRLQIMRDPRLGSYGGISLCLALLLRALTLAALATADWIAPAVIAVAALSRAILPIAMSLCPQARQDGAAVQAGRPHPLRSVAALIVGAGIAFVCLPPSLAALGFAGALFGGAGALWLAWRRLGGVTGDVLGAMQQVAELGSLLAILAAVA